MFYIPNDSNYPYFNLAFEEYCLGHLPTPDTYFILWCNAPAVIIGRNQDLFQEVDYNYTQEHGIYIVRRITGGGAVYHDLGNLNISIMGSYSRHPNYAQEYGEAVCDALRAIGLTNVEMNGRNDLYVDGKKISGWAKRIQGDSFLLHGTLLYDVDLDQLERVLQVQNGKMQRKAVKSVRSVVQNIRDLLPFDDLGSLRKALEMNLRGGDGAFELEDAQVATINQLVHEKYETEEWITNVSFTPTVSQTFQTVSGRLIVNVLLKENAIAAINFRGDFLGNKETHSLCEALKGVEWKVEAIQNAVAPLDINEYFTGLNNQEFIAMLSSLI